MNSQKIILIIVCFLSFSFKHIQNRVEKVYAKMESKQLQSGKYIVIKSEICYKQTGEMVTHFTSPTEYIAITNKSGELKMYDPKSNTVIAKQATILSSQSSQFYYFLSGKINDMGLIDLGYVPIKTYPENNLIISEWQRKVPDTKSLVQTVKLVHNQQKPIFMEYKDKNKVAVRKVYYYSYKTFNNFAFPSTTTEIIYNSKSDSVITKTVYSDVKINEEANSKYFDFKIPANAKTATN